MGAKELNSDHCALDEGIVLKEPRCLAVPCPVPQSHSNLYVLDTNLGANKPLEQSASTPNSYQESALSWNNHRDSNTSQYSSLPVTPDTSHVADVDDVDKCCEVHCSDPPQQTLVQQIRDAMVASIWMAKQEEFLPLDKMNNIMTKKTILRELERACGGAKSNLDELASIICCTSPSTNQPSAPVAVAGRRKLFAILTLANKVAAMPDLIEEGISDENLPFTFHQKSLCLRGLDGNLKRIKSFGEDRQWQDLFYLYQWRMLSPYFQLSCPEEPKVPEKYWEEKSILPFVYYSEVGDASVYTGGFSYVRKVKIHQAHSNSPIKGSDHDNCFYAVKTLHDNNLPEEVKHLKRFVDKNNDHLIRLLFVFQYEAQFHLVFPWADSNLLSFWCEKFPHKSYPPRDCRFARWIARELLGLVQGLSAIHTSPIDNRNNQSLPPEQRRIYGRHGDIKPQNILWFRDPDEETSIYPTGILQIADFGLADFRSPDSVNKVSADSVGCSLTYRAPECDSKEKISPLYDMWSLGCVILQFITWYIHGWEGLQRFEDRRVADSIGIIAGDSFFNVENTRNLFKMSGRPQPIEKGSVLKEIEDLRKDQKCSGLFRDILDFTHRRMLQIHQKDRAECPEIVHKFSTFYHRAKTEPGYCTVPSSEFSQMYLTEPGRKSARSSSIRSRIFRKSSNALIPDGDSAISAPSRSSQSVHLEPAPDEMRLSASGSIIPESIITRPGETAGSVSHIASDDTTQHRSSDGKLEKPQTHHLQGSWRGRFRSFVRNTAGFFSHCFGFSGNRAQK